MANFSTIFASGFDSLSGGGGELSKLGQARDLEFLKIFKNRIFQKTKVEIPKKSTQRTFHLNSMSSRERGHAGLVFEAARRRIRYLASLLTFSL